MIPRFRLGLIIEWINMIGKKCENNMIMTKYNCEDDIITLLSYIRRIFVKYTLNTMEYINEYSLRSLSSGVSFQQKDPNRAAQIRLNKLRIFC